MDLRVWAVRRLTVPSPGGSRRAAESGQLRQAARRFLTAVPWDRRLLAVTAPSRSRGAGSEPHRSRPRPVRALTRQEPDMLRSLLVLATALGTGLAPAVAAAPRPEVLAPAAIVDAASADPGLHVATTTLVVASAAEASTRDGAEASTTDPGAREPAPAASESAPAPTAPAADAPGEDAPAEDAPAEVRPVEPPEAAADEAAAVTVDPAAEAVVADTLSGDDRVLTPAVATPDVQTLGVTWPEGADAAGLAPSARTLSGGEWSPWSPLEVADTAPDAGTSDAAAAVRGGTESFWIGEAEAVQLSFAATPDGGPADLDLTLVGSDLVDAPGGTVAVSGVSGDAVLRQALATTGPTTLAAVAPQPAVVTRAQWGARSQVCAPDVARSLVGAVVHHTAGSNAYTSVAQAMQQIRNDQAYHIDGRGWCDIGYNFIVDKWGNIYEGRANSLTQAVIGVHAGGFNTGTVGVSMLGSYTTAPSAATQDAVGRIIGWRLAQYGVDPQGWMSYATGNGENSRYKNQTVNLPRVFGHRDVSFTTCPGDGGYAALDTIRRVAASIQVETMPAAEARALVRQLYRSMLGREADGGGLAKWSEMLRLGQSDVPGLVDSLGASAEYRTLRVSAAYRDLLGRAPDAAGLQSWVSRIAAGSVAVDDVRGQFLDRDEYYRTAGGTDRAYIARLYEQVLGRAAGAGEVDTWAARVPGWGRAAVVQHIWSSDEARRHRVDGWYRLFLGRAADGGGLTKWAEVMRTQGEPAVRRALAASAEYRALALRG